MHTCNYCHVVTIVIDVIVIFTIFSTSDKIIIVVTVLIIFAAIAMAIEDTAITDNQTNLQVGKKSGWFGFYRRSRGCTSEDHSALSIQVTMFSQFRLSLLFILVYMATIDRST